MKALTSLSVLALTLLAACGGTDDAARSTLAASEQQQVVPVEPTQTIVYGRDLRPVDGTLVEVKFAPAADTPRGALRYEVSLRKAGYDRINGTAYDTTEVIDEQMTCAFAKVKRSGYERLECRHDMRPVDGALHEVVVEGSKAQGFTATLRTAFYDRINGQEIDTTKVIGRGLERQAQVELPRMCTMIAGVLYNPSTKACAGFSNGCQMSAMLESGFTQVPEGVSCSL